MRISAVKFHVVKLPFHEEFAREERIRSPFRTLIVEVVDKKGISRGWGEGILPVGENDPDSSAALDVADAIINNSGFPWHLTASRQVWFYVDDLPESRQANPLVCAAETALLDALGRDQHKPLTAFFPSHYRTGTIRYGATIALNSAEKTADVSRKIREMDMRQLRVVMDADIESNRDRMLAIQGVFGSDCDIRLDPKGSWNGETAMAHLPMIRHAPVRVVIEPMPLGAARFREFARELKTLGVELMASRSAATLSEVNALIQATPYRMIDIKLSRSGGFRRAMRVVGLLRDNGLPFQIGCHLGESGILSAAGRTLQLLCRDARYREGAYDPYLLRKNLTCEHVSFGHGGKAGPLTGAGLGVRVDRQRVLAMRRLPTRTFRNPDLAVARAEEGHRPQPRKPWKRILKKKKATPI
jgi:muconate cycloisomerase